MDTRDSSQGIVCGNCDVAYANSRCLHCEVECQYLCADCAEKHSSMKAFRRHEIIALEEFRSPSVHSGAVVHTDIATDVSSEWDQQYGNGPQDASSERALNSHQLLPSSAVFVPELAMDGSGMSMGMMGMNVGMGMNGMPMNGMHNMGMMGMEDPSWSQPYADGQGTFTFRMFCPYDKVKLVIGAKGFIIKSIMQRTDTMIIVNENYPEGAPRRVDIRGYAEENLIAAKNLIEGIIEFGPSFLEAGQQRSQSKEVIGLNSVGNGGMMRGGSGSSNTLLADNRTTFIPKTEITVDLYCPADKVSIIIGAKGVIIKEISRRSGAQISIDEDPKKSIAATAMALAAAGVNPGSDGQDACEEVESPLLRRMGICGTAEQVEVARTLIIAVVKGGPGALAESDVGLSPEDGTAVVIAKKTVEMECPKDKVGALIGSKGVVIRDIKSRSSTQICIGKTVSTTQLPRGPDGLPGGTIESKTVTIRGTASDIEKAVVLIQAVINRAPDAAPHSSQQQQDSSEMDADYHGDSHYGDTQGGDFASYSPKSGIMSESIAVSTERLAFISLPNISSTTGVSAFVREDTDISLPTRTVDLKGTAAQIAAAKQLIDDQPSDSKPAASSLSQAAAPYYPGGGGGNPDRSDPSLTSGLPPMQPISVNKAYNSDGTPKEDALVYDVIECPNEKAWLMNRDMDFLTQHGTSISIIRNSPKINGAGPTNKQIIISGLLDGVTKCKSLIEKIIHEGDPPKPATQAHSPKTSSLSAQTVSFQPAATRQMNPSMAMQSNQPLLSQTHTQSHVIAKPDIITVGPEHGHGHQYSSGGHNGHNGGGLGGMHNSHSNGYRSESHMHSLGPSHGIHSYKDSSQSYQMPSSLVDMDEGETINCAVECPDEKVGLIIGSKGVVVKSMMKRSKAKIVVTASVINGRTVRIIEISGSEAQVRAAKSMVDTILLHGNDGLDQSGLGIMTKHLEFPQDWVRSLVGIRGAGMRSIMSQAEVAMSVGRKGSDPSMRTITLKGTVHAVDTAVAIIDEMILRIEHQQKQYTLMKQMRANDSSYQYVTDGATFPSSNAPEIIMFPNPSADSSHPLYTGGSDANAPFQGDDSYSETDGKFPLRGMISQQPGLSLSLPDVGGMYAADSPALFQGEGGVDVGAGSAEDVAMFAREKDDSPDASSGSHGGTPNGSGGDVNGDRSAMGGRGSSGAGSTPRGMSSYRCVRCPSARVGTVIGTRGSVVKEIMRRTGSVCKVGDPVTGPNGELFRDVYIHGPDESTVVAAELLVRQIISNGTKILAPSPPAGQSGGNPVAQTTQPHFFELK